jgi:hypothetical protein
MTFTFKNNPSAYTNGSCLQGYIETTYDELVNMFGEPTELKGDKTNVEWVIRFSDGTVASIYDWKLSENPTGVYKWHIGGMSQRAVTCVNDCMLVPAIALAHNTPKGTLEVL